MVRRLTEKKLVVASHNPGKVREISELLKPYDLQVVSASDLGLPEPEETGTTFAANAKLKALASATGSGLPALADDSGLVVPALGGDPGIYSARWAGPDKDFNIAMKNVIDKIGDKNREAHFFCALAIAWPDGHVELFEGTVNGALTWPMRGSQGFGYDPIFVPDGFEVTFGEMEPEKKHAISHRANAFRKFIAACLSS
ncbi:MAG: RdgB/HAM1 family non-canonical purine NTP pyrophosphatase [Alphaproteobacteria bacterium]